VRVMVPNSNLSCFINSFLLCGVRQSHPIKSLGLLENGEGPVAAVPEESLPCSEICMTCECIWRVIGCIGLG
jgi:hypothetical protein